MKRELGCMVSLFVAMVIVVGTILSFDKGSNKELNKPVRTAKLIDSVKIDSTTIIKIYRYERTN